MHFYHFFGLNIQSAFKFPFLDEQQIDEADVFIEFGKIPEKPDHITNKGVLFQASEKEFLFRVPDICGYYVTSGNRMIIEQGPEADNKDIYAFMAGSAMGALLQQRDMVAFHGCTVEKSDKAFMFAGHTGSGKSTTGIYMFQHGYKVISDDISVIDKNPNNGIRIIPGPPYFKLWLDVIRKLKLNESNLQSLRNGIHKYIYPFQPFEGQAPLKAVFVLKNTNNKGISFSEIKGAEKFNLLRRNIYKPQFARHTAFESVLLQTLSRVAQEIPVILIEKGQDKFYQDKILEKLENFG